MFILYSIFKCINVFRNTIFCDQPFSRFLSNLLKTTSTELIQILTSIFLYVIIENQN
ncbi:hypothetical protein ACJX0J_008159 [Zea mays]